MKADEDLTADVTDEDWDSFVFSHPRGNIFQTRALSRVYAEAHNYHPVDVAVIDPRTHRIRGLVAGVIIRELDGILGGFSAHSVIQGGPLIASPIDHAAASELMRRYNSIAGRYSLYNEIRNLSDVREALDHIDGYTYVEHLNFLIDLEQSEDSLWNQIHKMRRKNITHAEKEGVIIEEVRERDMLATFYELLGETYDNVKLPLADRSLFESAFERLGPKGMVRFFLARHGDRYIGARAVLLYKGTMYDWYAGAAVDTLSYRPNDYLVWHILKWGMENGFKKFDFGGAGEPDKPYGPREFKKRFGGELVNYGRYVHEYSRIKNKVAKIGFKAYQKLS